MHIYKHSHFLPDGNGHGGTRRTAQINELLDDAGIAYQEVEMEGAAAGLRKGLYYLKGLLYQKRIGIRLKNDYAIGRYLALFERFVKSGKPDVFIQESTGGHHLLLSRVLKENHIPAVALPHNLESLVSGTQSVLSGRISPGWLAEEVKYLSYYDHLFTISREEAWLLSNFGLPATCLPYYPVRQTERFLTSLRYQRGRLGKTPGARKEVLLLGTFYNLPTAEGYIELIRQIGQTGRVIIHVAGYGSEQLEKVFNSEHIHIWGSVDNEKLAALIIQCDCAIVHQQPSSGALTRIIEMLIAGLPVLANIHAARSHFDYCGGLMIYESYSQLFELLQNDMPVPAMPDRPSEEVFFVEYIRSMIERRQKVI
jgi:glycosyltransferase involved in cell wall biosynthesis